MERHNNETLGEDSQGFTRLWRVFARIHGTLGEDLQGFVRIHKDSQDFGRGFVRIHETLGDDL